jgi:AcrR family transcriptional regulator
MVPLRTRNSERTKERILNAAERLFSQRGIDGVSVRDIAAAAGVQLALISYYFGNKQGLYRAVFRRRIDPISAERLSRLGEILSRRRPQPTIEEVLDALARPWVELREKRGGLHYTRLIAREVADPNEGSRGVVKEMLDPIALKFIEAMGKVLPNRPRSEIHWAYHLFIGGLLLILLKEERIERLSGRLCDMRDSERVIREIVGLFARALRNPSRTKKTAISADRKSRGRKANEARDLFRSRRRTAQRRADR